MVLRKYLDGPAIRNANRDDSQRESGRFKSSHRNTPLFTTFERLARIASNLRFAIRSAPEKRLAKKGNHLHESGF